MMNTIVPLKGAVHSLRGTSQMEAIPLRAHIFGNDELGPPQPRGKEGSKVALDPQ